MHARLPRLHDVFLICTLIWGLTPCEVRAHAALYDRIAALNVQIEARPEDARLYLKRGELHRAHQHWAAALADYERAEQYAPGLPDIAHLRGRMWLEADRPALARPELDRFLSIHPQHANARLTRARILARLCEPLAAADDLAVAMEQLDHLTPELYLERARLFVQAGGVHVETGLQILEQGIARLGPLVTLVGYAIEVETSLQQYDDALARLDLLPPALATQPHWLKRRGDLLRASGQNDEALIAYRRASQIIAALPPARRSSPAMQNLASALHKLGVRSQQTGD